MDRKIWTAAEVEKMTPVERREISRNCEALDPSDFPELLVRARESIREYEASSWSARRSWPAGDIFALATEDVSTFMALIRAKQYDQIDRLLAAKNSDSTPAADEH